MTYPDIVRIPDEERATSTELVEWERRHAAGTACMYQQPWFTGIFWEDKCMSDAVVVWDGRARYCADHALSEGPPEWFHELVEVTVLPGCPPGIAAAVRTRESALRARADGTDGFDWRSELIAAAESWAARDDARPDSFTTAMVGRRFSEDIDPGGTTRRVELALAAAVAERRRTAARTEHGSTGSIDKSAAPKDGEA